MTSIGVTKRKTSNIVSSATSTAADAKSETQRLISNSNQPRRRRRKRSKYDDEPFYLTFMKVAVSLALFCFILYFLNRVLQSFLFGDNSSSERSNKNGIRGGSLWDKLGAGGKEKKEEVPKLTKFPEFELGEATQFDVWGMSAALLLANDEVNSAAKSPPSFDKFLKRVELVKSDFSSTYGGENAARAILQRGLTTFEVRGLNGTTTSSESNNLHNVEEKAATNDENNPKDNFLSKVPKSIRYTAGRILKAKESNKPFRISFAGASAVSGAGNYFDDAFPTVFSSILTEPMEFLGIELIVRNAAVPDVASFPYGWCLDNFLGWDADVVSWDSGMNARLDTVEAFEAYLRHAMSMSENPMMVVKDGTETDTRRELLQEYVNIGALIDPIVVDVNAAAQSFLNLSKEITPIGFQSWNDFSAPAGSPGRIRTSLPTKQHELTGWLLSMHFLAASELVVAHLMNPTVVSRGFLSFDDLKKETDQLYRILPKPISPDLSIDKPSKALAQLHGNKLGGDDEWFMDSIHCRTSYEPIVGGTLEDMVVSGPIEAEVDLLFPKGPMLYNSGWVLDFGPETKRVERSIKHYKFDYRYNKKAYFGIAASGTLKLFVPFEDIDAELTYEDDVQKPLQTTGDNNRPIGDASSLFNRVIVCETNEEWGDNECDLERDMTFIIGGETATDVKYIEAPGVSYMGRKTCVTMTVPSNATLTTRQQMKKEADAEDKEKKQNNRHLKKKKLLDMFRKKKSGTNVFGLSLHLSIGKSVTWKDGPCSVSHVIWEQTRRNF